MEEINKLELLGDIVSAIKASVPGRHVKKIFNSLTLLLEESPYQGNPLNYADTLSALLRVKPALKQEHVSHIRKTLHSNDFRRGIWLGLHASANREALFTDLGLRESTDTEIIPMLYRNGNAWSVTHRDLAEFRGPNNDIGALFVSMAVFDLDGTGWVEYAEQNLGELTQGPGVLIRAIDISAE
jgi:hypothetical protein